METEAASGRIEDTGILVSICSLVLFELFGKTREKKSTRNRHQGQPHGSVGLASGLQCQVVIISL